MKLKGTLILLIAMIIMAMSPITAYAGSYEIATAHAYYIHPVNGMIEDAGNNPGIGQGMCENVLHGQALIEVDDNGLLYATVRYNLAQYTKGVQFAVQNRGDDSFYKVDFQVMQQGADTVDYRFQIPAKEAIVRSTFFVGPMGRDVVFYFDFSGFTPGNTDFVLSVSDTTQAQAQSQAQAVPVQPAPVSVEEGTTPQSTAVVNASQIGEKIETKAVNDLMGAGDLGYKHGLLTNDSPELGKLKPQKDGKTENETETEETGQQENGKSKPGFYTKALFVFFLVIVGGLLLIGAITISRLAILQKEREITRDRRSR
ncbi:MAG: ABC transporter [Tissierellia bacterium]|nr:ABC transporter [Tissierellia bacterium]